MPVLRVPQRGPQRIEGAAINSLRSFESDHRQLWVIELRRETLRGAGILRRRKSTANIASYDPRFGGAQARDSPFDIFDCESPALPVCHRVLNAKTIKIDRDVNI